MNINKIYVYTDKEGNKIKGIPLDKNNFCTKYGNIYQLTEKDKLEEYVTMDKDLIKGYVRVACETKYELQLKEKIKALQEELAGVMGDKNKVVDDLLINKDEEITQKGILNEKVKILKNKELKENMNVMLLGTKVSMIQKVLKKVDEKEISKKLSALKTSDKLEITKVSYNKDNKELQVILGVKKYKKEDINSMYESMNRIMSEMMV